GAERSRSTCAERSGLAARNRPAGRTAAHGAAHGSRGTLMRLVRLDLIRYGHFTDVTLEFQPGFNLVLGANVAGKSTTLRALRQLLFGFDHRCPDAFLHPTGSLRIGAVIEDHAGTRIECIRRKSQRDSLRGPDDVASLPDDLLERILDGVDQAAFQQR